MPSVPRLQRQVDLKPLPGARLQSAETDASTGAIVDLAKARQGEAIARVGGAVASTATGIIAKIRAEEEDRANKVANTKAKNFLDNWRNLHLYDPDNGAFTKKGEAALGLPEQVDADFEKDAGEYAATLTTERQKEDFDAMRSSYRNQIGAETRRHTGQQMEVFETGEAKASILNSINNAGVHANDPATIAIDIADIKKTFADHPMGMGPKQLAAAERDAVSAAHSRVVNSLLNDKKEGPARTWYTAHEGEITEADQAPLKAALEEGSLRGAGQAKADEIFREGGTLAERREKVRNLEEAPNGLDLAKYKDEVLARVKEDYAGQEAQKADDTKDLINKAYNLVYKSKSLKSIPPADWVAIPGPTKVALESWVEHLQKGTDPPTDWETWVSLMKRASKDPKSFISENPMNYRHKLGDTEFKQLVGLQNALQNGLDDAAQKQFGLGDFSSNEQVIRRAMQNYPGMTPLPGEKETQEQRTAEANLYRQLQTSVDQFVAVNGRKPDQKFIQEEVDKILSASSSWDAQWGGLWRSAGSRRFIDATIADVTPDQKARIKGAIFEETQNANPTDQQILDFYIRMNTQKPKQ